MFARLDAQSLARCVPGWAEQAGRGEARRGGRGEATRTKLGSERDGRAPHDGPNLCPALPLGPPARPFVSRWRARVHACALVSPPARSCPVVSSLHARVLLIWRGRGVRRQVRWGVPAVARGGGRRRAVASAVRGGLAAGGRGRRRTRGVARRVRRAAAGMGPLPRLLRARPPGVVPAPRRPRDGPERDLGDAPTYVPTGVRSPCQRNTLTRADGGWRVVGGAAAVVAHSGSLGGGD